MASNTLSINKIIRMFQDIAERHLMINSFSYGPLSDINTEGELKMPYLHIENTSSTLSKGTGIDYREVYYNFDIYVMDRINKGDSNYQDTTSDTLYILQTIITEISQHPYYVAAGLKLVNDIETESVFEATDENVNGHRTTLRFKQGFRYTPCTVPIDEIPGWTFSLNGSISTSPVPVTGATGATGPTGPQGATGADGSGSPGNNDVGVMYLKNNTIPTIITAINERKVVTGTMSTGILFNFIKDTSTNSLKYTGPGARFHIIANFSFSGGNRDIYGFYIGKNTNPLSSLDPNADRISESEVYVNSNQANDQPAAGSIQTVLDLNTDDRVFFIVQNRETTADITVEFMKFVVTSITAEKGPQGATGPTGFNSALSSASIGAVVTGTVNNTFSKALFVPANSYTIDDVPEVSARVRRVTGATGNGAYTARVYWNVTADIAGTPFLLAIAPTVLNTANSVYFSRNVAIVSATNSTTVTELAGAYASDFGTNANGSLARAPSNVAIDWTQNGYIVVAIQFNSSLGSGYCELIKIRK